MKQLIIDKAKETGIEIIGFTTQLNYSYLKKILLDRANKNYNNEFEEQNIDKRLDVRNIFPECKSIIACGFSYAKGYKKINTKGKGLLSIVSFGIDYHTIVKDKLNLLSDKLKEQIDFKYMVCVDTTPLIDREICKSAGIGNYGRNSLLINEEMGSFMYLGYLLTDLNLQEEETRDNIDICKNCDLCIKSCPNNAILEEGVNTKKCISYLTQTKNYIPLEYRKNMKNQIYGCDMCQLVCPKNKKVSEIKSDNNYDELLVDLNELLTISNIDFKNKYGCLSGSWRGKNIWKRNALISIANLDMKYMFDKVKYELNNPSEMIKIYAAWSLIELNKKKASDLLYNNLKYENEFIGKEYNKLLEV